jgi:Zn-dependent protease with chaperone function
MRVGVACLLALVLLAVPSHRLLAAPYASPVAAAQSSVWNAPIRMPVVTPRMRRYTNTGNALYFGGTAYTLLVLWLILALRVSARLRALAERVVKVWPLQLLLTFVFLSLVFAVLLAPLTYAADYGLEHAYGLSHESTDGWLADEAKNFVVNFGMNGGALLLLYWLIRRSPRRWGLWLWVCLIPLTAIGVFAQPLVIDPLFNRFRPMPPSPLEARIRRLAAHAGIPDAPIYIADKSKQTDTINAYVTGIGSSARIVIWDTTLKYLPDDEVVGIVGHEMGHYVLKHIYWLWVDEIAILLIVLPLGQKAVEWQIARFGKRWGIRDAADPAAIPVFLLSAALFMFLLTPLGSAISRHIEHQADAYGLHATHNGPAMARAFIYMAQHDLSDPYPPPFIKFWLYDHPPLGERIDFVLGRRV